MEGNANQHLKSFIWALKKNNLASNVYGLDNSKDVIKKCRNLNLVSDIQEDLSHFKQQFELIIICSPLSTYKNIFLKINKFVTNKTLLTDVGSTKLSVIDDFTKKACNQLSNDHITTMLYS